VPITAELGGKAPVIIFDDFPLDEAVAGALFASFIATGQTCVQGARILVHESIYESFLAQFNSRAAALVMGDPMDAETQIGPLVSKDQRDTVAAAVQRATKEGAVITTGGSQPEGEQYNRGAFYQPTVITGVNEQHTIWREEVFGPVAVVRPFTDEQDAINLGNDADFGLAGSIWTRDIGRSLRVAEALDIGIMWVNDHHRVDPASPWGGMKDSGIGSENSIESFRDYTQAKSTIINTATMSPDWFGSTEPMRYS
jgi:acyl-CoA reductase-like NAD-dependent aldehyde dehydrogenase